MISVYVREQKRYSKEELQIILSSETVLCSESDVTRIIKKLKQYGILKTVNKSDAQKDLSDLYEEDVVISDEDDKSKKHYYVFTFVGLIIIEGRVLKCIPKYIYQREPVSDDLELILKVLRKYNSKEQVIKMYNYANQETTFNRLSVMMYLINDYFDNGIYTNTEEVIETNGMGEINWDRTINNTFPILSNSSPYYVELQTKKRKNDEDDFIKKLHEVILSSCSKELQDADLLSMLGIDGVFLADVTTDDIGDKDYLVYRIDRELNIQFNTRKQIVLNAMRALITNTGTLDDANSFSLYGTNSFNLVWEEVCSVVMNNSLHTPIKDLEIVDVNIPAEAKYSLDDELISIIEKPKWIGNTSNGDEYTKEADQTLKPDLISVYKTQYECDFIIFDAKYYVIHLEKDSKLSGNPGVGDVTKQYLYQLAYQHFIESNKIDKVKNCFLMPTDDDDVHIKGIAKIDMLSELGLGDIQIREIPARRVYECYLNRQLFDISKLEL